MLLLRTKPEKQSQVTAEKVPGELQNRKITVTPEKQTTNTTKSTPKQHLAELLGYSIRACKKISDMIKWDLQELYEIFGIKRRISK